MNNMDMATINNLQQEIVRLVEENEALRNNISSMSETNKVILKRIKEHENICCCAENEVLRLDKMILEKKLKIATEALERYSNSRYWSSNNIYDTPEDWGHYEACEALEKIKEVK